MAEFSMWWTTGGAGDGSATYTRTDHAMWSKVLASCNGLEGIAPNYLNKLAAAAGGANTVNVASGGGLVDGKVYNNSASVAVNIPSAVGGGNTRIDRIVLRANWTAQTVRITRIPGTDAASPVAPAITQSSGATYDIMICRVLVDTAGAVTVTDERVMAQVQTADLADLGVTTGKIAANGVDNTKIRDSAGLSVIGRGANTSGDPADITAGTDAHVLRRAGTALAFGQVATGGITDLAVTEAKIGALAVTSGKLGAGAVIAGKIATGGVSAAAQIANDVIDSQHYVDGSIDTAHLGDLQVTSAKLAGSAVTAGKIATGGVSATGQLADDIVDDTKAGNRVVRLPRRQGGSATDWRVVGTTNYTPTGVIMQAGFFAAPSSGTGDITYPIAYSDDPIILILPVQSSIASRRSVLSTAGPTGCSFRVYDEDNVQVACDCWWLAIGPE